MDDEAALLIIPANSSAFASASFFNSAAATEPRSVPEVSIESRFSRRSFFIFSLLMFCSAPSITERAVANTTLLTVLTADSIVSSANSST